MARREADSGRAALGFRVKSGWALAIVLTGEASDPRVGDRQRVALADPSIPESAQPYHEALDAPEAQARAIVSRLVAIVEAHTALSVSDLLARLAQRGWGLEGAGLVVGSVADPAVIANAHIRAHAEEGRLFRRVLEEALDRGGLAVAVTPEKHLWTEAAAILERPGARLRSDVAALGKGLGGPWRAEEKASALAAWMALRTGRARRGRS